MAVRPRVELLVTTLTNLLSFPVVIWNANASSSYMIPSVCAIQMELQHVFLECGSDAQGLVAFVRVSRDLPAFNRQAPVVQLLYCTSKYIAVV